MVSEIPTEGAGSRPDRVLIFNRDPKQAEAYRELFEAGGYQATTAMPTDDVQKLCEEARKYCFASVCVNSTNVARLDEAYAR